MTDQTSREWHEDDARPAPPVLVRHDQGRRDFVILIGSVAAGGLLGCGSDTAAPTPTSAASPAPSPAASPQVGTSSCVVRPALTEGPYFVDERLNRSDIRSDPSDGSVRPGVPLLLTFAVSRLVGGSCSALTGAVVDVWHCDALGAYSDVSDMGFNTRGSKFLRGYQQTDAAGRAQFTTIYPGWYSGRAVHLHFKIRTSLTGPASEFTSQVFFDEAVTDQVHAQSPYNQKGRRNTLNLSDGIYRGGGSQLLLALSAQGTGYAATFDLALQS
jgi:protocatechuate 3,4-dioxygenase beta subunit